MNVKNWECPKCYHQDYDTDQLAATGGGMSRFFNIQNKKYTTITCKMCRFTELYKAETTTLSNVLDFFGN
jgi:Predicted nucleic-acid-binding protein containing a Zn-ribbon domain